MHIASIFTVAIFACVGKGYFESGGSDKLCFVRQILNSADIVCGLLRFESIFSSSVIFGGKFLGLLFPSILPDIKGLHFGDRFSSSFFPKIMHRCGLLQFREDLSS